MTRMGGQAGSGAVGPIDNAAAANVIALSMPAYSVETGLTARHGTQRINRAGRTASTRRNSHDQLSHQGSGSRTVQAFVRPIGRRACGPRRGSDDGQLSDIPVPG